MKKLTFWTGTSMLLLGLSVNTVADTLSVPPAQSESEYTIQLPGRGMTKEAVEESFGTPLEKIAAVGEPPISRWLYHKFTVYFEYEHVIHAVVNK